MSKPGGDKPDELEGTEAPFVSHLIELRDRLIRAVLAIGVAFALLAFWPGPSGLYDMLAAPLTAHLPQGAKLIATNVISPILVPLKITLMAPSWRRGFIRTRRRWCCRWSSAARCCSSSAWPSAISWSSRA